MHFTIHNVGHGFCAHLLHDNGNCMVWDCGHVSNPDHRPSDFLPELGIRTIHRLIITNFDEDHISDLPNLRHATDIRILRRNRSISPERLREIKLEAGPISAAMEELLRMLVEFTGDVASPPDFPRVMFETFNCIYPDEFTDTNSLSVVSFLQTPMGNFVIAGDLTRQGWNKLLERNEFRDRLRQTNIFVASHHGRSDGFCEEVFSFCTPDVVIFSDGPQRHATQEEAARYGQYARGITFNGQTRYVLTTRQDGSLTWNE